VRVTVVRPGDLGPSEVSLWARFQKSSPELQNPFFSLAFAQAVDRHRTNSRVAVVEDDAGIQAFLPFDLGPQRIGWPIGDPMNNLQGFVSEGGKIDARRVIRKAGLRGWRYTAALTSQRTLTEHHYEGTLVEAPVIDLSGGYEAYFAARSKKFLADYGRKMRALERDVGPVSLEWGATAAEHVRQFIDWKIAKYGGARYLFAEAAARRIVEELCVSSNEDCGGVVNVLRAGDQVVAISSCLTCPGVLCGWFMAYDDEMKKYSPGTTVMIATLEEAERRHITRIDMGAGQDSYKARVANASYPVAGGAVWVIPGERAARRLYRRWRG
jgi:CelD/BcsL family acetyltransferase involved in cellulose biosynthesis